jgi:hypothetical protein
MINTTTYLSSPFQPPLQVEFGSNIFIFIVDNKKTKTKIFRLFSLLFLSEMSLLVYSSTANTMTMIQLIHNKRMAFVAATLLQLSLCWQTIAQSTEISENHQQQQQRQRQVQEQSSSTPSAAPPCFIKRDATALLANKRVWTVGVLAHRGEAEAYEEFNNTFAAYLTATAGQRFDPPIEFQLKPLDYLTVFSDAENGLVDFIYANPSAFSCIETEFVSLSS